MDKDVVRIIIVAIGLLAVLGMIGWSYLKKAYQHEEIDSDGLSEQEHSELGHNESDDTDLNDFDDESHAYEESEETLDREIAENSLCTETADVDDADTLLQAPTPRRPMIIQFSLVSEREEGLSGTEIFEILDDAGLEYGNLQIFERLDARRLVDFGVANMVKPGIFPSTNLAVFHCPGVVFFMQPGKLDNPVAVFDDFVRTFQYVAHQLGGEMKDPHREPLTDETIAQLRESLSAT